MAAAIRVLYVDDEPTLLDTGKKFLEQSGEFAVTTATSAPDAIRLLEQEKFDTIVSDYQMPGMDGIEFLVLVRTRFGKIPFILFTGKGREEVVIQAINSGADFYLQKGGDFEAQFAELSHKVKQAAARKMAEDSLRKSEDRHRTILQTTMDGIWMVDSEGNVTDVNETYCRMSGYTRAELLKLHITALDAIEESTETAERVRRIIANGSEIFETRHRRKDGSVFDVEVSTTYLNADGGKIICFCRDITERKRAEEALNESERRFRELSDLLPQIVYETDANGILTYANRIAFEWFGYTEDEFRQGLNVLQMLAPHDRERGGAAFRAILEGKGKMGIPGEYHALRKDGGTFPISIYYSPVIVHGRITGLRGIIIDITERKRAEEALRESEVRYRAVVEDQTEFICRFTPDGRLTFVNDSYCRYFSLDKDQCLAHPHSVVMPPEDANLMKHHLASLTMENPFATIEHRIIMPSGEVRWQRWNDRAIFDKEGQVVEYQSVGRDITEIKNAEKTLRESEAYYRTIFENTGTASVIVEEDTTISLANAVFANLSGHSREEIEGKRRWTEYVVKEDLERMLAQHHLRRKDGKQAERHYEFRFVRKNGEVRNIFLSIDVIPGTKKSIASLLDITKYKRAEQALQESEERLNLAIDGANLGLWDLNFVTYDVIHNRQWTEMLGFSSEEMNKPSSWWQERVHPDDSALVSTSSEDHTAGRTPFFDAVYRMKHKDGSWRWVHSQGKVVSRDTDSRPLRMIGINQDVTDHKQTEVALRGSERQFRALSENSQDNIMRYDKEHRHTYANPACLRVTGMTAEQFIGRTHNELGFPPDLCALWESAIDRVFATGQPYGETFAWTGVDGEVVLDWRLFPEKDAGGSVVSVLGVTRDITAIKAAEQALRESEAWYRQFFTTSRDCVFITTPEGRWIDFNDVTLNLLGYRTREELGGVSIPDLYESANVRTEFNAIIIRNGYVEDYPVLLKKKDGTIIDTLITTVPLKADDGSVKAFFGTVRDVTEKKRADEEIRTLQQFQQSIIDNANVWIGVLDPKGTILVWNNTAEQISGYPAEDVIGKNTIWKQLYPDPVYRKQVAENILSIIHTNAYVENFETRIRTRGGDEKIIWWNTQPLRDASGKPVQFIAIGRDVTERRQAEEWITALRQFEESVIKNANIWISVLDGKGTVSIWNNAAEEISGYRADEVIGKNTIWSRMYPDKEYRYTVTAKIKEVIGAHKYLENFETRIRTKDGQERIIWWNTRALQDIPGIDETFIAIGKDVTEQKTLQDAVQLANKKLNLLSSITRHDIINQLLALNGYLELSRDILGDPVKLEEYITKEQNIANTIEAQILFTKDYQELGMHAPVWQNVHKSVDIAIESLPLRGIAVETDSPTLEVYADPLLVRVFYNLIDNALRYGGEQMTTIRISSQESSRGLLVVCEDDGVGVPVDEKEAIFNRGFFKHTGFGLFLSREILAITGITIAENGTPGKGARFEITVPKGMWRTAGKSD